MTHSSSSSIKSRLSTQLPTSLAPRPIDARKVSTATFGDGQRGSLLIPAKQAEGLENFKTSTTTLDEPIDPPRSNPPPATIEENDPPDDAENSTSVQLEARVDIPSSPFDADDYPQTPNHPETPQTSTSLASYISDTSTLGPLATQQDIKDDPSRVIERRQVQRKKLEKMLGNGVEVEDDDVVPGKVTWGFEEGQNMGQDDWILVTDGPELCKSKLERCLGQGADSAHLVLNAEYRRRSPDIGDVRVSEDSDSISATHLLKALPLFAKPANRVLSTSDLLGMAPLAETTGKPRRSGSLTNVFDSGKKTLARLNQGTSTLRKQRAESPDSQSDSNVTQVPSIRRGSSECLEVGDADLEERRILRNRTRKIGRVLGETLKENEVGQHVVGKGMARKDDDMSESSSIDDELKGRANRLSTFHEGQSQLRLSLGPAPFEGDDLVRELLLPSEDTRPVPAPMTDKRLSIPLSPTFDGFRRHSDPISPMRPSLIEEASTGLEAIQDTETESREMYTYSQAKKQRRLRLDKLNRLLGAHVPLKLLGPAVYPKRSTLNREPLVTHSTDDESEEAQGERKKRAVRVASKMFNLFGEPPPNPSYPLSTEDDTAEHSDDVSDRNRSRFRSSVAIYRQTIGSIRYLLEHDRRSLVKVMDELEIGRISPRHPDDPFHQTLVMVENRTHLHRPQMVRKRSLSSPSKVTIPLAVQETSNEAFPETASPRNTDFDCITGLRKRAGKLNAFFGDPRVGSGYIGTRTKQYQMADRKAALEKLLLDLEDDANSRAEQGDLKEIELEEIRTQLSDTRQAVKTDMATGDEVL